MEHRTNLFTNMPSLLRPTAADSSWPLSLNLPEAVIFFAAAPARFYFTDLDLLPLVSGPEALPKFRRELSQSTGLRPMSTITGALEPEFECEDSCSGEPRKSRKKLAWTCAHTTRYHYAKGKCQLCYLKQYNRKRTVRGIQNPNDQSAC